MKNQLWEYVKRC